jgi:hypothetical protein
LGESEIALEGLDHQQTLVLGALRRAAGAPVSFAELREAGVELPASVVSELELAGVAIERCRAPGRGTAGVRLDPAADPANHPGGDPVARPAREPTCESARRPAISRALVLAALLAATAVVSALVATRVFSGDHGTRVPTASRPHSRPTVASTAAPGPTTPRSAPPAPRIPVSPAVATELEAQGHGLLQDGRYGAAVPVLKRAVLATGESLGACLEPAGPTCLTYAYALYDLGRAVRLSGEPEAAVPILERRLRIDNQRSTVDAQLQLARQGIG